MATPPSADTVDTVPSIVKDALHHTTHDPNVAVASPSKPTSLVTAVASLVPTLATCLRPAPSVTNHAVPATVPDARTHTPPDPTVVLDQTLGTRTNRYRPSKPTSTTAAVASLAPTKNWTWTFGSLWKDGIGRQGKQ
eukprot:scaffold377233_cov59-Attheya_sp.AAC.1